MAQEKIPQLRFIVKTEKSDDLVVLTARLVYIDPKDGRIKNPLGGNWRGSWENGLADLTVRAQANLSDGQFYGYEVEYSQPFSVRLVQAEAMVKTLRKIQKHLDKLEAKYGHCDNVYTYLAWVADAIGVVSYGDLVARSASFYNDNEYRWGNIDQAKFWVQEAVVKLGGVNA